MDNRMITSSNAIGGRSVIITKETSENSNLVNSHLVQISPSSSPSSSPPTSSLSSLSFQSLPPSLLHHHTNTMNINTHNSRVANAQLHHQQHQQLQHQQLLQQQQLQQQRARSELEAAGLMVYLSCQRPPPQPQTYTFYSSSSPSSASSRSFVLHPPHNFDAYGQQIKSPRSNVRRLVSPTGSPCPNCGVLESTLWRSCQLLNGSHYLCNACGLRYKKGKYCPVCYKVYYDVDTNPSQWKQCHICLNWTHKACLPKGQQLANSVYTCLVCQSTGRTVNQIQAHKHDEEQINGPTGRPS